MKNIMNKLYFSVNLPTLPQVVVMKRSAWRLSSISFGAKHIRQLTRSNIQKNVSSPVINQDVASTIDGVVDAIKPSDFFA